MTDDVTRFQRLHALAWPDPDTPAPMGDKPVAIHDIMLGIEHGQPAVARRWPKPVTIDLVSTIACGDRLFVERNEQPRNDGEGKRALRCAGIAHLADGDITLLRDYYDRGELLSAMGGGQPLYGEESEVFAGLPVPLGASSPILRASPETAFVARFFEGWRTFGAGIADAWHDDGVFDNVPAASGGARSGRAAIADLFDGWSKGMAGVDVELISLCGEGGLVFAERLDHVRFHNGVRATLPCLGVLAIEGGRISRFTDYFDLGWFSRRVSA